jgi:hypothetical protein
MKGIGSAFFFRAVYTGREQRIGGSVAGEPINWDPRVNVVPCLLTWPLIKVYRIEVLTRVIVVSGLTLLGHPSAFLVRGLFFSRAWRTTAGEPEDHSRLRTLERIEDRV